MKKTFSVLGLAAAVLVVALALSSGYADNALGRSKCPSGTQEFVRVCIDTKPRPSETFDEASTTCASERRRLPTGAELDAFRQQEGIVLGEGFFQFEWTGDIIPQDTSLVMSDEGLYHEGSHHETIELPFRCVK